VVRSLKPEASVSHGHRVAKMCPEVKRGLLGLPSALAVRNAASAGLEAPGKATRYNGINLCIC
jgi:hypothetical protein